MEEKVEPGDWYYTSGDDRIFPRGFPIGVVKSVRPAQPFKEILVEPSGLRHGLEDVLIVTQGAHQDIPDTPPTHQPVYIAPPPPAPAAAQGDASQPSTGTEADKLRTVYQSVGEAQNHVYGTGAPGSKPPDFTKLPTGPGSAIPGVPAARAASPTPGQDGAGQNSPAVAPHTPVNSTQGQPASQTPARPAGQRTEGTGGTSVPPSAARSTPESGSSPSSARPAGQPPNRPPAAADSPAKNVPAPPKPTDPARRSNQAAGAPGGPGR
jgi:rod shape-determining protein MreC